MDDRVRKFINGAKILWTNPNPNSNMSVTAKIQLASNDYDMLKVFFKQAVNSNYIKSIEVLKGQNMSLDCVFNKDTKMRLINYTNDTEYTGYVVNSNGTRDESICIPLYIVGYKTGLF